ncbi:MAG: DUF349 domain-containing protein [Fermentimonas sp.]|jgi:hypothetical protein
MDNTTNNLDNEKLQSSTEESANDQEIKSQESAPVADESTEKQQDDIVDEVDEQESEVEINYDLEELEVEDEDESEDDEIDENSVSDEGRAELISIEEINKKLQELLQKDDLSRKDIEEYKNQFYRSLRDEIETQKQAFLKEGGEEIDFVASEPQAYTDGKEYLQQLKEKRAEILKKESELKEQNVARKLAIIDQIKELTESNSQEDFNKTYQHFKALQQEWNDIKLLPQGKANELWKSYQRYVEKFYDLVRINQEFREYDFRKNYELKTELCVVAEKLDAEPDVVSAFHQLQNLHQEWREIGPVARKDREDIWNRFKEASTVINKKYQSHFESLREKEEENLKLKTEICEKFEAIDYTTLNSVKQWNSKVKEVLDLQAEWKTIGFVPKKWNTKIYKRYRAACDTFFRNKNEFYKSLRNEMDENLAKKTELCERAEALKDSTDWANTTQELIDIQKKWKEIGMVPRKYSDSIWKRFITACDHFFEQKKIHSSAKYAEEVKNLEAKNEIVKEINDIDTTLDREQTLEILHELIKKWHNIGHVPYKAKDTSYKEFRDACGAHFDRLNIDKAEQQMESFRTSISDLAKSENSAGQLNREREKLMRQYERMKAELQTYENNLGFLSISSKKGNALVDEINKKAEKIKAELQLIVRKIEEIDKEL